MMKRETRTGARALGVARAFAMFRGAMLVLFCVFLALAPEQAKPGSSTEALLAMPTMGGRGGFADASVSFASVTEGDYSSKGWIVRGGRSPDSCHTPERIGRRTRRR